MKKHLLALTFSISLLASASATAGAGAACHFHGDKPAAESTVLRCAVDYKAGLVKDGKIDASWLPVKTDTIEAVDGKNGKEWKVTFRNPGVTDKARETLYMFYTRAGNFIAANFTGQ